MSGTVIIGGFDNRSNDPIDRSYIVPDLAALGTLQFYHAGMVKWVESVNWFYVLKNDLVTWKRLPKGNGIERWIAGSYSEFNIVLYGNVLYESQLDNNTVTPGTDNTKWLPISGGTSTPNTPPIVSAGTSQNLNLSTSLTLTLTGTITPGTSAVTSTLWVQTSGPVTLTIANPASLTTNVTGFTPAAAGPFQFELKCFTADGSEVDAFVTEVIAYIPPQIISSNQNIQLPTNTGTMSAIVTAGSYAVASSVWSFSGGQSGVTCDSAGNYSLPNIADTYAFTLVVTDVNGHTATITRSVTLTPASIVIDFMFATSDQYTALQSADTLTYSGHYNLPSTDADWPLDFTSAPANCFPVIRRPSGGTLKNRYTDSGNPTFGTDTFDGNSSSARVFTARGYDYYTWYAPANFTTTAGNKVNITIL